MFNKKEIERLENIIKEKDQTIQAYKEESEKINDELNKRNDMIVKINSAIEKVNLVKDDEVGPENEIKAIKGQIEEMDIGLVFAKDNLSGLASAMTQISASTQETAANVNEVTATAENTARLAGTLVNIAKEGIIVSRKTIQSSKDIEIAFTSILDTVAYINDLASRINLLSLNARIEAAHAGEKGEGFGIIAGEIKNLADDTAEKVKSINELIKVAKEVVIDGVTMSEQTEKSFKQVEEIAEQNNNNASETVHAMQEINVAATQTSNVLAEISNNTEDLKQKIKEVQDHKPILDELAEKLKINMTADEFEFFKSYTSF